MPSADPELSRALAARAIEGGLLRLKWLAAATRFELAMRRHERALKAELQSERAARAARQSRWRAVDERRRKRGRRVVTCAQAERADRRQRAQ